MTLTSDAELNETQAACPGEEVTFTCVVTGTATLRWTTESGVFDEILFLSDAPKQSQVCGGFHAALTSNVGTGLFRNLTSTLSVTSSVALDGTVVNCGVPGGDNSSKTLNFASK